MGNGGQRDRLRGVEGCGRLFRGSLWVLELANLFHRVYDTFRQTRLHNVV